MKPKGKGNGFQLKKSPRNRQYPPETITSVDCAHDLALLAYLCLSRGDSKGHYS